MTRSLFVVGLLGTMLASGAARAQDAARTLADELTAVGARAFVQRDVDTLTASYDSGARVTVLLTESDGRLKEQSYATYDAIRGLYVDLFKGDGPIEARNIVDHARFLTPDLLLITGTLEATKDGTTSRLPFVQVRRHVGTEWRITRLDVYATPQP